MKLNKNTRLIKQNQAKADAKDENSKVIFMK
jgi:hypothetical protein